MHHLSNVSGHVVYGGMRLKHNPCEVFIDNPLFSELISVNPGNTTGTKSWARYVRQTGQTNRCFVPEEPGDISDYRRLERRWQRNAKTQNSFDQLWGGWHPVEEKRDLPWLVVCPRDEILEYWYGRSLSSWQHEIAQHLTARGDRFEFKLKVDRKHRMHNPERRVIWIAERYRGIITAHSVSAIDAILAGRPAVIWGQDPTLGCATPWTDFLSAGIVYEPEVEEVQEAAWTWAKTTHSTIGIEQAIKCIMK